MRDYPLFKEAGLLIAYARVHGPKGSRFVRLAIDTGATATMIPPKIAIAIGLHPTRSHLVRETLTVSGKEFVPVVVVPRFQVFEKTLRRVTVTCHELPPESPIDGLLGLDILTRLKAILDLAKPSIRIT